MMKSLPSMVDIKIGPDGIADRQQVIELLEAQIAQMRTEAEEQHRMNIELSGRWETDLRRARELNARDAKDLKRLRSRQMQILERWVRREGIRRDVIQHRLIVCGIVSVALPVGIVILAFAWRLAAWAVLS